MNVYHTPELAAAALAANAARPATAIIQDAADARVMLFRIEPGQQGAVHTSPSTVLLTVIAAVIAPRPRGTLMTTGGARRARAE